MADDTPDPINELVAQLRAILSRPFDFRATNTDATLTKVRILVTAANYFNMLNRQSP